MGNSDQQTYRSNDKPDDVSLAEVHEEMRELNIKDHGKNSESSSSVLNEIRSSLGLLSNVFERLENRLIKVENRFEGFENRLIKIEKEVTVISSIKQPTNFCFFDINVGRESYGRFIVRLWDERAPTICANFRGLVAKSKDGYKNSRVQTGFPGVRRIRVGYLSDAKDFDRDQAISSTFCPEDNTKTFKVERVNSKYDSGGLLAAISSGGTLAFSGRFEIATKPISDWNDRSKDPGPFGEVIVGLEVIEKISNLQSETWVTVADCGFL